MNAPRSDTLVFFGATGDLAYKKIFPALQAMVKRGSLNVPVIGLAREGWNLDRLKARAKDSLCYWFLFHSEIGPGRGGELSDSMDLQRG
jgi:glucose-6-phosphate 1-dehydrogenase